MLLLTSEPVTRADMLDDTYLAEVLHRDGEVAGWQLEGDSLQPSKEAAASAAFAERAGAHSKLAEAAAADSTGTAMH